jgi:3-methyladenine DNA glycosylase AlkD
LSAAATSAGVIRRLKKLANPANVAGMARYGISTKGTLGVNVPVLRRMAKEAFMRHDSSPGSWMTPRA